MYVYIHSETAEKITGAGVKADPETIEKAEKAYDGLVLGGKDTMKTLQYKK
jgi:hypothetical protein